MAPSVRRSARVFRPYATYPGDGISVLEFRNSVNQRPPPHLTSPDATANETTTGPLTPIVSVREREDNDGIAE
jgi:hypothetical protein